LKKKHYTWSETQDGLTKK